MLACTFDEPMMTENYTTVYFMAKAKIIRNYTNADSSNLYKAELSISELFKGESLNYIYVAGRGDVIPGNSSDLFIPKNTEQIVYAIKDHNGNYKIGMCSGLLYLNNLNKTRLGIGYFKNF